MGILDDVKKGTKKIAYGLGVGEQTTRRQPRWESDQTELAIGAGNSSNPVDLSLKKHGKIKNIDI